MLTSGLLLFEDLTVRLLMALIAAIGFLVAWRELKPFYEVETDVLSYACGMFGASNLSLKTSRS